MPYGIKGKTKQWEENTKAGQETDAQMESCVMRLMNDKNFLPQKGEDKKTAAIRVCKASMMRSREMRKNLAQK